MRFGELGAGVWVCGGRSIGVWLLPSFHLSRTRCVRHFCGYLMYVFREFFYFSGITLSYSRASSDCLCTTLCILAMLVIRGLTFHPTILNV